MSKIHFTINYEIKTKRKLEKFLEEYKGKIGFELRELKIDRYWKIQEQFQAVFYIESDLMEKEQLVYQTLVLANKLSLGVSNRWIMMGPYENESRHFECMFDNKEGNQPLKWVHVQLEMN